MMVSTHATRIDGDRSHEGEQEMSTQEAKPRGFNRRQMLKYGAAMGAAPVIQTMAATQRPSAVLAQDTVKLSYLQIGGNVFQDFFDDVIIPEFQEQNPNIEIEQTVLAEWDELYQKTIVSVAGGNPPDVIRGKEFWLGDFASRGVLQDLTDYVENSTVVDAEKFTRQAWQGTQWEGRNVAIPLHMFVRFMFYNKDLLEKAGVEPPTTWEEWTEAALAITDESNNIWGTMLYNYNGTEDTVSHFQYLLHQAGGQYWDDVEERFTFNSPEGLEALQFQVYQLESGASLPMGVPTTQVVETGNVGIWISGSWSMANYAKNAPDLNYGVGLFPGNETRAGVIRGNNLYVFKSTDQPAEAFKFVEYLMTPEANLQYGEEMQYVTALRETQDQPFYQQSEAWETALKQTTLEDNTWQDHFPGYPESAARFGSELQLAYLGEKSPEQALADGEKVASEVLQGLSQ